MRIKVSENGALIPKDLLTGITEVDIRKQNGVIVVIPAVEDGPISESDPKHPQFGSPRDLIRVSGDFDDEPIGADDPIFNIGRNPVSCGISDASENLDKYLYGGE